MKRKLNDIKSDVWRYEGRYSVGMLIKLLVRQSEFRPIFTLRICQRYQFSIFFLFFRALHQLMQWLAGYELPWKTEVGSGFRIVHGYGLVINENVKIGSNVTILHGVTIGERAYGVKAGFPQIQDNVTIGAGAIIIGKVVVGEGSVIGAGAIATRDVPPHCIVAVEAAKIIKTNVSSRVINPYHLE